MPVSDQWADRLVVLALEVRPTSAPRWDGAGIRAHILKVQQLPLGDVAKAVIRAAEDTTLRTPAAISDFRSSAWRERNTDVVAPHTPHDPEVVCGWCSRSQAVCESDKQAGHAFESCRDRDARVAREQAARRANA